MSHIREGDMFELADEIQQNAVIKVIGVGGGGGNAVQHMRSSSAASRPTFGFAPAPNPLVSPLPN